MSDTELPPDPFPPPPAPTGNELAIEAVPLNIDSPDLAQWCASCLLPSALGYRFRILANGRPLRRVLTLLICADCGAYTRR